MDWWIQCFGRPTGNVGGIFGPPFSFFSPKAGRQAGKVEPQIAGTRRSCLSQRRPGANHNDIKQSNLQSTEQRKNGRVPQKRDRTQVSLFSWRNPTRRPPKKAFVSGGTIRQEMGAD